MTCLTKIYLYIIVQVTVYNTMHICQMTLFLTLACWAPVDSKSRGFGNIAKKIIGGVVSSGAVAGTGILIDQLVNGESELGEYYHRVLQYYTYIDLL